ncbi:MAG TPA: hypothetical protein VMV04_16290 [Thermodesulfobacteriota bacterium]|nr:hypothetical protein [Thermodesulfobacteriota bacterium]
MRNYDLCLTWNWEYDADFVRLLSLACQSRGLSFLQITPENVLQMMRCIANEEIGVQVFFDRASDADTRFIPVVQWARNHVAHHINFHELARRAWDKAAMHQVISASVNTPLTLTLPSYDEQPMLPEIDLSSLGESFTIKPAYGGGGVGVINEATTLSQVLIARQEFPTQRYLLQDYILPARLGSRMAWFRAIYCTEKVYLCWWDHHTHIYTHVTSDEETCYNLGSLHSITSSVAHLCGLTLFSSEIALTADGRFVIIDYVNDPIDLRLQSKTFDGVPDDIVRDIAERLADFILIHHAPLRS